MKTITRSIVPALFILLFTYAAFSKLLDWDTFRAQLYLQPFSRELADLLSYVLPFSELILALLLCFEYSRFSALVLSTGLMVVFTAYISLVLLHYWNHVPCSCGGILNHLSWTTHLAFNWAFILAGITGIALDLSVRKSELIPKPDL